MDSTSKYIFEPLKRLAEWISHPNMKRVYYFREGSMFDKNLLGSKGANLCEMSRMGLAIPPGFVISTESCMEFFHEGVDSLNHHLVDEYSKAVRELERKTGRKFGSVLTDRKSETIISQEEKSEIILPSHLHVFSTKPDSFPLLLSIRPSTVQNYSSSVDTVLNLGMNEEVIHQMILSTNNPRFVLDSYRRFQQMYGELVLDIERERFVKVVNEKMQQMNIDCEKNLRVADLRDIIETYKAFVEIPSDPFDQLKMAITAVFAKWFSQSSISRRELFNFPPNIGTAITIQSMVFGNQNNFSGSGFVYSRNPDCGFPQLFGEYSCNTEGDVKCFQNNLTMNMHQFQEDFPEFFKQLLTITHQLEKHFKDAQKIEFTVENGKLFILESASCDRSPRATCKIAVDMVMEGILTERDALLRIDPKQMDFFLSTMVDHDALKRDILQNPAIILAKGTAGSPGAAIGCIVFTNEDALNFRSQGLDSILCKIESSEDDIFGLESTQGLITMKGGINEHLASAMRAMGKPVVLGVPSLKINFEIQTLTIGERTLNKGDTITICGSTGMIFSGSMACVPFATDPSFVTVLRWASKYKRMRVMANCSSLDEARLASVLGSDGIGLFSTDQMMSEKNRLDLLLGFLLTDNETERQRFHELLLVFHQNDFREILQIMKDVTVSLFNSPLCDITENYLNNSNLTRLSTLLSLSQTECERKIKTFLESVPIMGVRGCRLGALFPEIFILQTRALINAASSILKDGGSVSIKIVIPFVCSDHELMNLIPLIRKTADTECERMGLIVNYQLGVLLELPRACLRAGSISSVKHLDFISFETNKLTEFTYGLSKDANSSIIDKHGVGTLLETAIAQIRRSKSLPLNVCGDHSKDSESIRFFDDFGINSVSCPPIGVPAAKIASAQASIEALQREEADWMDMPYIY